LGDGQSDESPSSSREAIAAAVSINPDGISPVVST